MLTIMQNWSKASNHNWGKQYINTAGKSVMYNAIISRNIKVVLLLQQSSCCNDRSTSNGQLNWELSSVLNSVVHYSLGGTVNLVKNWTLYTAHELNTIWQNIYELFVCRVENWVELSTKLRAVLNSIWKQAISKRYLCPGCDVKIHPAIIHLPSSVCRSLMPDFTYQHHS